MNFQRIKDPYKFTTNQINFTLVYIYLTIKVISLNKYIEKKFYSINNKGPRTKSRKRPFGQIV